jgi:hypothetical protein
MHYTKLLGRVRKKNSGDKKKKIKKKKKNKEKRRRIKRDFPRASQPSSIIGTNIYYIQQVHGNTTQERLF